MKRHNPPRASLIAIVLGLKSRPSLRTWRALVLALFGGLVLLGAVFPRLDASAQGQKSLRAGAAAKRPAQSAPAQTVSQTALQQIGALASEKAARTPAQKKIDSNLLAELKMSRGQPVAKGVPRIDTGVAVEPGGMVLVDIKATVTDDLLKQIRGLGGEVVNSFSRFNSVRARVPLARLEEIAGLPGVRFVRRAVMPEFSSGAHAPRNSSFAERGARVRSMLPGALGGAALKKLAPAAGFAPLAGSVTSEGDRTHRADTARSAFGVSGAGVRVGVISDSVDYMEDAQASGDLGVVSVLSGQSGTDACGGGPCSGEGTAMLEIVHDLAPDAHLFFATAFHGPEATAQNILDLRAAGCDIIVDDVGFPDESPFQDAVIAQAVNIVTDDGALYFSSAGNSGNWNDGTSGTWEGDFVDAGPLTIDGQPVGRLHTFGPSATNTVLSGGSNRRVDLFWSDPLGFSANDYDVYVLDSTASVVLRKSDNSQTGAQDPYESIDTLNVGENIIITKFSGSGRYLHLETGRGRLNIATPGRIRGHSAAGQAFSVAAVDASTSYPNPFAGGSINPVENFSSDGPRRIFYDEDGDALTPGNFSSTGGVVRQKPDIAAADGVVTTLPEDSGLNPVFGTSAAAPHAAAVAALLKSYNAALTTDDVRDILTGTALNIEAVGEDRDSGAGIVMAYPAIQSLGTTPSCGFAEGFNDITALAPAGWSTVNNSSPLGTTGWFQGSAGQFPAQSGATNSYIAANFNNASSTGTISNWLLSPPMTLQNGAQLIFYTRTTEDTFFPDRLQVRMSLNGTSANVGASATTVGDFTALLLDINPDYTTTGYPREWARHIVTLSGISTPTVGRLAFRYFVESGGPSGSNSNYVGIDSVQICGASAPPVSLRIDNVSPRVGRASGGQQVTLTGDFTGLSTVSIGGTSVPWSSAGASSITFNTPAHAAGAVSIALTPTSGGSVTKANAFAYLPTVFTDNTLTAGVTQMKVQHITELRQAVDSMRAVAGLSGAPWTDPVLTQFVTPIKAAHITELRTYLEDAASRLGFAAGSYTDPTLGSGFVIKRAHVEELRQRIRNIAG